MFARCATTKHPTSPINSAPVQWHTLHINAKLRDRIYLAVPIVKKNVFIAGFDDFGSFYSFGSSIRKNAYAKKLN